MITSIFVLAIIGFCISLYTYIVEEKIKREPDFKPVCDLSDRISCSAPMKSKYANLFYFSNAFVGMGYYLIIAIFAFFNLGTLLAIATVCGCLISAVLAYLLYFKIKALCILCTSLYIINIALLILSLRLM